MVYEGKPSWRASSFLMENPDVVRCESSCGWHSALLLCKKSDFTVSKLVSSPWDDILWSPFTNCRIILQTHLHVFLGEKLIFSHLDFIIFYDYCFTSFHPPKLLIALSEQFIILSAKSHFWGWSGNFVFVFWLFPSSLFWEKCCEARRHA